MQTQILLKKYISYFSLIVSLIGVIVGITAGIISKQIDKGPGQLLVSSLPSGAKIIIDGKDLGTTPAEIKLHGGIYNLKLSHPNYQPFEQIVKIEPKQTETINMQFSKAISSSNKNLDLLGKRIDELNRKLSEIELKTSDLSPSLPRFSLKSQKMEETIV